MLNTLKVWDWDEGNSIALIYERSEWKVLKSTNNCREIN
jgi:hypothetical protein